MRTLLSAVILLGILFTVSGCAPKEGTIVTIPDGTEALQVKFNRSGLDKCTIPSQDVTIKRNTYWEWSQGSAGSVRIDISEVSISQYGSCDQTRSVFIKNDTLNDLIN